MELDSLLIRLDALDAYARRVQNSDQLTHHVCDDADDIVEELLTAAQGAMDLTGMELRLNAQKSIDLDCLSRLCELLAKLSLPASVYVSPQWTVDVPNTIQNLRNDLDALKSQFATLTALEIRIDVEMKVGTKVRHLLIAAAKSGIRTTAIESLIENKLGLLADSQLQTLWAATQAELDAPELSPLVGAGGVIPASWRMFDSRESVCRKYSAYVVNLKYKMMSLQQANGITAFPVNVHEVANIASWKDRQASEQPTAHEIAFQKSLARIVESGISLFGRTKEDFANMLRVSEHSPLLRIERRLFENTKPKNADIGYLLYETRKAIHLLGEFLVRDVQVETALRQHKLGLEVMASEVTGQIGRRNELRLQRELSRFLIERGIYAAGTKFGRAETDLVTTERSDHFILEVKKFSAKSSVTPRNLFAALVQLQSYMDQHPANPRGIVMIYNLSDTVIVAPEKWLRGKYRIVVVNLGRRSPSNRLRSICIEEGDGDATIDVHWLPKPQ